MSTVIGFPPHSPLFSYNGSGCIRCQPYHLTPIPRHNQGWSRHGSFSHQCDWASAFRSIMPLTRLASLTVRCQVVCPCLCTCSCDQHAKQENDSISTIRLDHGSAGSTPPPHSIHIRLSNHSGMLGMATFPSGNATSCCCHHGSRISTHSSSTTMVGSQGRRWKYPS